ncbi:MAG: flavodoxin-dependent (E)-4-hydroxy-3-methylbut-2-enyl-diphosphate synthase [Candidatus Rokubacteria bacterium]|nr:flavodoxin-dependent (E)-4-hydroxy-3-methylbut-2-enyl-diphosphate synthase [Candidatus Rokubacteria bacterium]MBI3827206.1 flavodoxin-dependent (E)-4-hydroxy-3-methylbut-2-enyl-diphosphate synthase [Candidatus Rokubacteria bacterium]
MTSRRKTRQIQLAGLKVGGDAPITVQSMTKTDTRDVQATLLEIWALEAAGCDVVRCAVPVREAAEKLGEIKRQIRIPLVADIHFNYKLALIALEQGVDGLRLNPGNIGGKPFVQEVVNLAKDKKIPIRIGVNAGSLEKDLLARHHGPTAEGMVESALRHIRILEDLNYPEMKISLKASDPRMMIEAYRLLADQVDYPFHLGVTEAGTPGVGTIKSAVGLGALLSEGIGDTIRVSLSADPTEEVRVGIDILKALSLRKGGLTFVSCPSCGRADVDLVKLAREVEDEFKGLNEEIHIAVMGCVPEGQPVVTASGVKPIEDVTEGDDVVHHEGRRGRVLWTTRHAYEGEIVEVQPTGFSPYRLTPNHRVWAFSRPVSLKQGRRRYPSIERTVAGGARPEWIRADQIEPGWVLVSPILQDKEDRATVDIPGIGEVPLDDGLLTLFGYYLSEGSLSGKGGRPYQQIFCFHERQEGYPQRLRDVLRGLGLRPSTQQRRHTLEVVAHSLALGAFLERTFGRGSATKHLPSWIMTLPYQKQQCLVRALWEGDGYVGRVGGYWRATYTTTSPVLGGQVHQLLLRLGIGAALHHRDEAGRMRAWVASVTSQRALERLAGLLEIGALPGCDRPDTGQIFVDGRALYVGVRRVGRVPYAGHVHNLEVDGLHSFTAPGLALHNCEVNGPGEARAADIGVAGGRGIGLIFKNGEVIRKVPEAEIVSAMREEVDRFIQERRAAKDAVGAEG